MQLSDSVEGGDLMKSIGSSSSKSLKDIKITCTQGNQGFQYCIDCQNYPVMCRTNQCKCQTVHQICLRSKSFKKMNQRIISYTFDTTQLKQQLDKIFDKLIDQISQLRQKIFSNLKYFGLDKELKSMFEKIQNFANFQLKGTDIKKFFQMTQNKQQNFKQSSLLKFQNDIEQTKKTSLNLFQKISNKIDQECIKYCGNGSYGLKSSKIVRTRSEYKIMLDMFKQLGQIQTIRKIYRATEDGFAYNAQYEDDHYYEGFKKCQNKQNLLYLVQNQYCKKYGAFSPCILNFQNKGIYIEDPSKKTFIFSLDKNCKSKIIQQQYALRHGYVIQQQRCLISFGKSQCCSLTISQNSDNQAVKNWINGSGDSFQNNEYSKQQLYGSGQDQHQLKQIEVFQIKFKKS